MKNKFRRSPSKLRVIEICVANCPFCGGEIDFGRKSIAELEGFRFDCPKCSQLESLIVSNGELIDGSRIRE